MSKRKLFKPVMIAAGLCLTMWQLPRMLGAIDAARNPAQMSKFLEGMDGSPEKGATGGVSALMPRSAGARPARRAADGELTLYSPTGEQLTDEDRAKMLEQARRNMPRAEARRAQHQHAGGARRKSADQTITDAIEELNTLNPR